MKNQVSTVGARTCDGMMRILFSFLLLTLLCGPLFSARGEMGYGFQVVNVSYPEVVVPSETFEIDVTIHYWIGPYFRDKIQLQIRIIDLNNDATILIQDFSYDQYNVSGEDVYTFSLTAPNDAMLWNLSIRAYLVASHYDLTHAENDWYEDIEVHVSNATPTTHSTTTSEKTTTRTSTTQTISTSKPTRTTGTAISPAQVLRQNTYTLIGITVIVLAILAILSLHRSRSRRPVSSKDQSMNIKYCLQCGSRLQADMRFCNKCGAKQ